MLFLEANATPVIILGVVLAVLGAIAIAAALFFFVKSKKNAKLVEESKEEAEKIIAAAEKEAEMKKKESINEAKLEIAELKQSAENDIKERKNVVVELENKLNQREDTLDRRSQNLDRREEILNSKEQKIDDKKLELEQQNNKVEAILKQQEQKLVEISGLKREEARKIIMEDVHERMKQEIATYIKDEEEKAKFEVKSKAKNVLALAIQKYAGETAGESTVTTVSLPVEEMKGRIIGREGRNIRTIESLTGVDLIIDDTPEAMVVSSFDPLRREIAKLTIDSLIKDGRIHPARIEEIYDKTCKEMKEKIYEYGDAALFELGLTKVDPELIETLGKLHFRTSYGQNVLTHSIEVAHLAGIMAAELGENVNLAKRAGLFHDIGKAIDHEVEGSHVEIGSNIAKKYNENEVVINAIESHHGDTEATSIISCLVAIADALSASRPGARNDSLENYVQRLHDLENIANETEGVDNSFAIQAGRELRVIVKPQEIDDLKAGKVARDIKTRIENELQYPGTIKVTVIRETRVTEEAK